MFRLDNNFLIELGLGNLPPEEKNKMLAHIYETLEMRVGMKLAEQMSDAQLNEFESFIDRNDEAGALTWLETNFPNYKQVVADELEKLKSEIKQVAPQILASVGQAPSPTQLTEQQPAVQPDPLTQTPQQEPIQPQAPQQPARAQSYEENQQNTPPSNPYNNPEPNNPPPYQPSV